MKSCFKSFDEPFSVCRKNAKLPILHYWARTKYKIVYNPLIVLHLTHKPTVIFTAAKTKTVLKTAFLYNFKIKTKK